MAAAPKRAATAETDAARGSNMSASGDPGAARPPISFDDFLRVDVRVGTVVRAEPYPEARKPALKLWIDFGRTIGESAALRRLPATTSRIR